MLRCYAVLLRHEPRIAGQQSRLRPCATQWLRLQPQYQRCAIHDLRSDDDATLEEHTGQRIRNILSRVPPHLHDCPVAADFNSRKYNFGSQLLREQYAGDRQRTNILFDIAVLRGHWRAAVYIADQVLSNADLDSVQPGSFDELVERSKEPVSLDHQTSHDHIINPLTPSRVLPLRGTFESKLDKPYKNVRSDLSHKALGSIWHALGLMTLACVRDPTIADGQVKSEVLEILALFHRHGLMPSSVYDFIPNETIGTVQQPPTLYMLSSKIMTALSDATWRARERNVLEDARREGRDIEDVRLESRGVAVFAGIQAVKPEVWLELILWSCLHGGWYDAGSEILYAVCVEPEPTEWAPISWREVWSNTLPFGRTSAIDWHAFKSEFDTKPAASFRETTGVDPRPARTLSSELVDAYVEALATFPDSDSVWQSWRVIKRLRAYREFLDRSGLNLHSGTWDAAVVQAVENDVVSQHEIGDISTTSKHLLPLIGEELESRDRQALPAYVLDGNSLAFGMLQRCLEHHVSNANVAAAMKIYRIIQARVLNNQRESLNNFFTPRPQQFTRTGKPLRFRVHTQIEPNLRDRPIVHPGLAYQPPSQTLAALIKLLAETQSFKRGTHVLEDLDTDFSWLRKNLHADHDVARRLIEYASVAGAQYLYDDVVTALRTEQRPKRARPSRLKGLLQAVLAYDTTARNWTSAYNVLEQLRRDFDDGCDPICIAHVGRVILTIVSDSSLSSSARTDELNQAWDLLKHFMASIERFGRDNDIAEMYSILAVLSMCDTRFVSLVPTSGSIITYDCPSTVIVNNIIAGIAALRGSKEGQNLATLLMVDSERLTDVQHIIDIQASVGGYASSGSVIARMRQSFSPSMATYLIILRSALCDLKERRATAEDQVRMKNALAPEWDATFEECFWWCYKRMAPLALASGLSVVSLQDEVRGMLHETDQSELWPKVRRVLSQDKSMPASRGYNLGMNMRPISVNI